MSFYQAHWETISLPFLHYNFCIINGNIILNQSHAHFLRHARLWASFCNFNASMTIIILAFWDFSQNWALVAIFTSEQSDLIF